MLVACLAPCLQKRITVSRAPVSPCLFPYSLRRLRCRSLIRRHFTGAGRGIVPPFVSRFNPPPKNLVSPLSTCPRFLGNSAGFGEGPGVSPRLHPDMGACTQTWAPAPRHGPAPRYGCGAPIPRLCSSIWGGVGGRAFVPPSFRGTNIRRPKPGGHIGPPLPIDLHSLMPPCLSFPIPFLSHFFIRVIRPFVPFVLNLSPSHLVKSPHARPL